MSNFPHENFLPGRTTPARQKNRAIQALQGIAAYQGGLLETIARAPYFQLVTDTDPEYPSHVIIYAATPGSFVVGTKVDIARIDAMKPFLHNNPFLAITLGQGSQTQAHEPSVGDFRVTYELPSDGSGETITIATPQQNHGKRVIISQPPRTNELRLQVMDGSKEARNVIFLNRVPVDVRLQPDSSVILNVAPVTAVQPKEFWVTVQPKNRLSGYFLVATSVGLRK